MIDGASRERSARTPAAPRDGQATLDPGNDPAMLRQRWRRTMGRAAPADLSPRLMGRILAWREQISILGDIDRETRAKLAAAVGEGNSGGATPRKSGNEALKVGTILCREHNGVLHRVMVLDSGFAWNGQTYRSLSEVARAITGTSWNGYRFFAIKRPARVPQSCSPSAGEQA